KGADFVARQLIENAVKTLFPEYFPAIEKLEKKDVKTPYDAIVSWFFDSEGVEIYDGLEEKQYRQVLDEIKPLRKLVEKHQPGLSDTDRYFLMAFALWGLVAFDKLSKHRFDKGLQFEDFYSNY